MLMARALLSQPRVLSSAGGGAKVHAAEVGARQWHGAERGGAAGLAAHQRHQQHAGPEAAGDAAEDCVHPCWGGARHRAGRSEEFPSGPLRVEAPG